MFIILSYLIILVKGVKSPFVINFFNVPKVNVPFGTKMGCKKSPLEKITKKRFRKCNIRIYINSMWI